MFRIPVEIPLSNLEITYHDRVMTLGSCFAEIIGKRMNVACFLTEINPFGVLLKIVPKQSYPTVQLFFPLGFPVPKVRFHTLGH